MLCIQQPRALLKATLWQQRRPPLAAADTGCSNAACFGSGSGDCLRKRQQIGGGSGSCQAAALQTGGHVWRLRGTSHGTEGAGVTGWGARRPSIWAVAQNPAAWRDKPAAGWPAAALATPACRPPCPMAAAAAADGTLDMQTCDIPTRRVAAVLAPPQRSSRLRLLHIRRG